LSSRDKYLELVAELGKLFPKRLCWWYSSVHEKNTTTSRAYHILAKDLPAEPKRFMYVRALYRAVRKFASIAVKKARSEPITEVRQIENLIVTYDGSFLSVFHPLPNAGLLYLDRVFGYLSWWDFFRVLRAYFAVDFDGSVRIGVIVLVAKIFGRDDGWEIFKEDFYDSLFGGKCIEGLFYERAFERVAEKHTTVNKIIYVYEGFAWEKALCKVFDGATKVGVMCSVPSPNHMQYFYLPDEYMPKPDYLGVPGQVAYELMEKAYPDKVFILGTVRHRHLLKWEKMERKKSDCTLVILTPNERQNSFLINWVFNNLQSDMIKRNVALRAHPDLPKAGGWKTIQGSLAYCLQRVKRIVVYDSTVAVEALAFGLDVVVPEMPHFVRLCPLQAGRNNLRDYFDFSRDEEQMREAVMAL